MSSRIRTLIAGLSAVIVLLAVLVGVPVILWRLGTLPGAVPDLAQIRGALSRPDDGTILLGLFTVIAWAAWASFTGSVLVQLAAQLRHVRAPRVPVLLGAGTAGRLVAAALTLTALGAGVTAIATPAQAAAHATGTSTVATAAVHTQAGQTHTQTRTTTTAVPRQVTVEKGDSLWDIADEEYGDPLKWTRIYDKNEGSPQAGGVLENPDLIQPGLKLTIPGKSDTKTTRTTVAVPNPPAATTESVTPQAAAGGATPAPNLAQPATPPVAREGGASSPATSTTTGDQRAPVVVEADTDHAVVRTTTGLGALAAAGVLALLWARRARQSRTRRPGQRISLPAGDAAVAEAQLRAAADPLTVDDLDQAMRSLAAAAGPGGLPALRATRITPETIEMYLVDEAGVLPAPAQPLDRDGGIWVVNREDLAGTATAADQIAPYPTLVTLGHDEEDAHLLVNLEELHTLAITGPASTDVLTALVLELIASPWADDVTVSLAGVLPDLVDALGSDRATYSDDLEHVLRALEYAATTETAAYVAAGVTDPTRARGAGLHADTWTPHLLIAGVEPTPEQTQRLIALAEANPRVAIATVTDGTALGPWQLATADDGSALLSPAGLTITPQVLRPTDRDALLDAFRSADLAHHDGPGWAQTLAEELTLDELPPAVEDTTPQSDATLSSVGPETMSSPDWDPSSDQNNHTWPDEAVTEPFETTAPPKTTIEADAPQEPATAFVRARTSLIRPPTNLFPTDRPVLRLLGAVRVDGADPTRRPKSSGVALRILTHLALNPGGSVEDLDQAVWPGQDKKAATRDPIISATRRWLGEAEDGHPYLALWTPDRQYRLDEDLFVDWDAFQGLVGPDVAHAPLEDLTRALHLVDGKPLTGPRISETSAEREIIQAVADVAHEVATRACTTGDHTLAEWAAAKGITVEPVSEVLWRDRMRAAHQGGDRTRVRTVVGDYDTQMDAVGGDHDPETDNLIAQLAV